MSALKLRITSWGEVRLDKTELRRLMRSAGNDVKNKTARLISASAGSGRTYAGGGGSAYRGAYRPGRYRASAPGSPPVAVTGSLKRSLRTYAYKNGEGFAVRERQFYSLFLEAGARGGGNPGSRGNRGRGRRHRSRYTARVLLSRPHLDRVMAQEAPELDRRVRAALTQALKWRETK
jgi:hypothetical protein